jgi:hypothetical protein
MTTGTPISVGRIQALHGLPVIGAEMSLRAVVLLAGSVRATELSRSIGRSLLDLPLTNSETVLTLWQKHVAAIAHRLGGGELPVRVILNRSGVHPRSGVAAVGAPLSIEQERSEFRGTGGVLRDLCDPYTDSDRLLVANAAQILTEPMDAIVPDLIAGNADVSLVAHDDGTPSGLTVVRCGALASVRQGGFVDFKEQVLPRLAGAGHSIRVVRRSRASGLPVRTLDGYLAGLRAYTRLLEGRPVAHDPFEEDWSPTFALIEDGAQVARGATIHDSVILKGAAVGAGAVVVRSVICPGARVAPGATIADQIVGTQTRERRADAV